MGLVQRVAGFGSGNIMVKLGGAIADGIDLGQSMWEGNNRAGLGGFAGEVFSEAIGMCTTPGQIALIEQIGVAGFEDAAWEAIDNGRDATGILTSMTDHPEAIGEILEYAEGQITDALATGTARI